MTWEEAMRRFPVGSRVRGTVTVHRPYGVFVDLGDPVAVGLIQITDFLDEGRMTPEQYPRSARRSRRSCWATPANGSRRCGSE